MLLSSQHRQEETRYVNFEAQLIKTLQTGKYDKTFTSACSKSQPTDVNSSLKKLVYKHKSDKTMVNAWKQKIHYSYHLDHLHFLLWSKYQIYTALLETWILKMKKISAFFKGQLGIINNFIITPLLISIPFLCEYQYSLNQIIIKQMRKFLRPELYFAQVSIQK